MTNTKQLLVALGLALVVVIFYNLHIQRVRTAGRGETVQLLRAMGEIRPGQVLERGDLEVINLPRDQRAALPDVVTADQLDVVLHRPVYSNLQKGQFLTWSDVHSADAANPTRALGSRVAFPISFDSDNAPGDILRPGGMVTIIGQTNVGGRMRTYRIIEGVRVLTIGGRGPRDEFDSRPGQRGSEQGLSRYNQLDIEIDSDVVEKLNDALSLFPKSTIKIIPLGPDAVVRLGARAGRVSVEVERLAAERPAVAPRTPAPGARSGALPDNSH